MKKNLRVVFVIDWTNPKYVYVQNVGEAVAAITAAKEASALVAQKGEIIIKNSMITNLERLNPRDNVWEFWSDDYGRDINEYMNDLAS